MQYHRSYSNTSTVVHIDCSDDDDDDDDNFDNPEAYNKKNNLNNFKRKARGTNKLVERRYDPVKVIDLVYLLDWKTWLSGYIDPKLQCNTKGPLAHLFFGFQVKQNISDTEHNSELIVGIDQSNTSRRSSISTEETESASNVIKLRDVESFSRRFPSKAGAAVCCLLPDYSDLQFYEYFKKLEGRKKVQLEYDPEDYRNEIAGEHRESIPNGPLLLSGPILGIGGFRNLNPNYAIDNIIVTNCIDATRLNNAELEPSMRAHLTYDYCNSILKDPLRAHDDKNQIDEYMKELPIRPIDINAGFAKGAVNIFVRDKLGM